MDYELIKYAVESMTGGKNTIILDIFEKPSIMVKIPKQTYASLGIGSSQETHPAFIVEGVEKEFIYVSKYQNVIEDGCAYSLPNREPAGGNIDFEAAVRTSRAKGKGWHLMTNAEWAALALWCKASGNMPRGNTFFGHSHKEPYEYAVAGMRDADERINRCISGSGPVTWAHNLETDGVYDMNGNIWEWTAGARLYNGEIQVIANNDAAMDETDFSVDSTRWQAILEDGTLVAPGTEGTLKWDYIGEPTTATNAFYLNTVVEHRQSDDTAFGTDEFGQISAKPGVTVPELLKALAFMPDGPGYEQAKFWIRNKGECFALRGGCWTRGEEAGIFALNMFGDRFHIAEAVGFRSCYVDL